MSIRIVLTLSALLTACHQGGTVVRVESAPDAVLRDAALALDHPYFPLRPGSAWSYAGVAAGREVREEVRVLDAFEAVGPTRCVVLEHELYRAGRLEETTLQFFAGDFAGRLWLFGDETFDHNGRRGSDSWRADGDPALAVAWLPRAPRVGDVYEFALHADGERTSVVDLAGATVVAAGTFVDCLVTIEGTPQDGDLVLYAPGVGRVQEADADGRLELVDHR